MSRPKFVPTDAHRTKVRSLAAYGTKHATRLIPRRT